ncbi:hypothetical protein, conserved [Eimeria brunetti]|uniref:HMG box domain-containing protein n=1 Tax=Eimeria brunetti TaxID=51314 RepID=U6LP75_9EIME|nr:hypothetical protein, conserved [Eimeria brunetti]
MGQKKVQGVQLFCACLCTSAVPSSLATAPAAAAAQQQQQQQQEPPPPPPQQQQQQQQQEEEDGSEESSSKVAQGAEEVGEEWKKLTPAQRAPYEKKAEADKLRYQKEVAAYKKNKAGQ